ncbi:MAG TPA: hypothetical protein VFI31_06405 [Pirellulales bacterium]|nr:hypothetical protein [Pirellulales bacterium]
MELARNRTNLGIAAAGMAMLLVSPILSRLVPGRTFALDVFIAWEILAPVLIGFGVGRDAGRPIAGTIIGLGFWPMLAMFIAALDVMAKLYAG